MRTPPTPCRNSPTSKVDDVAVFDQALSTQRIGTLASGQSTPLTVPEAAILRVNRTNGDISFLGDAPIDFSMNFYRITSDGNSLNAIGWNSFNAQGFDTIDGSIGGSWDMAPSVDTGSNQVGVLAEAFLKGSSTFASTPVSIGAAYNTTVDSQDLKFQFIDPANGQFVDGFVEYVMSEPVDGDYDHNGIVDAADYTVWRDFAGPDGPRLGRRRRWQHGRQPGGLHLLEDAVRQHVRFRRLRCRLRRPCPSLRRWRCWAAGCWACCSSGGVPPASCWRSWRWSPLVRWRPRPSRSTGTTGSKTTRTTVIARP